MARNHRTTSQKLLHPHRTRMPGKQQRINLIDDVRQGRGLPARITAIIGLPAAFSLRTSSACAPGRLISARQCASPERIDSSPGTSARHQTDRLPRLPPQRRQYCDRGTLPSLEKVPSTSGPTGVESLREGHTQCGITIKNPGRVAHTAHRPEADNGYRTQHIRGQWEQRLCILQHDNAFSGSLSSDIQRLRIAISRQRFRFGVGFSKRPSASFSLRIRATA